MQPILWSFFLPKTYDLSFILNNGENHHILNISKKGLTYVSHKIKYNPQANLVHKESSFGLRLYGIVRGTDTHVSKKTSTVFLVVFLIVLGVLGIILFGSR